MRIEGAIPASLYIGQLERLDPGRREDEVSEPLTPDSETSKSWPDSVGAAEDDDENPETTRGVLRLLQEGHFKGVADVRLRINFFDELAAIEQAQIKSIASEKIDGIFQSVASTLESGEPIETPLDAFIDPFEQAVKETKEDFLAAEGRSTNVLISDLESAVEELVLSLTQALSSTATESPEEENVPTDIEKEENTPGFDLISEVRTAFSSAMDDLTTALSGVVILPELSEPNGNGTAYDKFLTIYNDMQTSRASVNTKSNAGRLDTSA
jgi:hypothetical protein